MTFAFERPYAKPCKHKTIDDFRAPIGDGTPFKLVRGPGAVAEYLCSICGVRFTWGPGSSFYGCEECPKCWSADVQAVVCSEACLKKHEGSLA